MPAAFENLLLVQHSAVGTTDIVAMEFIPLMKNPNQLLVLSIKKHCMANTYHQIYIHAVFAVKYRAAIIDKAWRPDLHTVIGSLVNETGCKTMMVNGVEDHVHCFFSLIPSIAISDVMKTAKAKSSKWINESGLLEDRFEWQEGYGCFSNSQSQIKSVYRYIENQELHHKEQCFKDEYLEILSKYKVDFDERYLFKDLI